MRRAIWAASSALALAACGGSDGGSGTVGVVSSTPTPTPTPTATPTPTPTPTATPTPTPTPASYTRYVDQTGDRTYQTACASLVGSPSSGLPNPQPSLSYGAALALGYTASTAGWAISGDSVSLTFAASDQVTAPTGQKTYQKTVNGSAQTYTIIDPVIGSTTLSYTRALSLRTDRSAGSTLYSCVFGVPSLVADVPTTAVSYANVAVTGTAYRPDSNGVVQTYVLTNSTATVAYGQTSSAVTVSVHLVGNLQTGTTVSTTTIDLGTYTGTGTVTAGGIGFSGQLDSANRVILFSSFSGAFFGNTESGFAFDVLAADTAAGVRVAAVGTVAAGR